MAQCTACSVVTTCAFLLFIACTPATSQDCSLSNGGAINTNLRSLLLSVGGEGTATTTTLLDHHFTCLAVGNSRDQYRQVSVAVRYTKNTASGQFTAQFTLRCASGTLASVGELDQSPPANVFNISTRRDCFVCTTVNIQTGFTIDTTSDCACELVIKHIAEIIYKLFSTSWHYQYVTALVWWWVKVAVSHLLTAVHSTTLMAPALHNALLTLLVHTAATIIVVSTTILRLVPLITPINEFCGVFYQ